MTGVIKRLLIHMAGFNLSLILRQMLGFGTARGLQNAAARALRAFAEHMTHALSAPWQVLKSPWESRRRIRTPTAPISPLARCAA